MAEKTYNRDGEFITITIHDGLAKGDYKLHAPEMPKDNQLIIGHLSLSNPARVQKLVVPVDSMSGLESDIKKARAEYILRLDREEASRVYRCERCSDKIEGNPVWRKSAGKVHDPLCPSCARLLRIAAGGIGVSGEPFESFNEDRSPYTKSDF